ncbi:MAG: C-terminal binding protein, partial [Acidobacteria bacterium]
AMALFLDCVRKVSRKDRCVRAGQWNLTSLQRVYRIAGKTFGFVGYGLIARSLHRKLRGFNLGRILVFDPFVTADSAGSAKVELTDLDTLCRESDFISIHVPLRSSTREMIGERQFSLMKSGAILINTSRGAVIHEQALISALKSGRIACAGLDVFATEPLPADSELRRLDSVTLTDHEGWYSEEAMAELKTKAALNIVDALTHGTPRYPVLTL